MNVTRVALALNADSVALALCGRENANEFKALAKRDGISLEALGIAGCVRTNVSIRERTTGRILKVNAVGPRIGAKDTTRRLLALLSKRLVAGDFLHLGGRLPSDFACDTYARFCRLAREAGAFAVVDCEGDALDAALAERPYLAKPNRAETEALLGWKVCGTEDALRAARELQRRGAERVVISNGGGFGVALEGDRAWRIVPPTVAVLGTTGAGDSLAGGLLAALSRGACFEEALAWGFAAGSATCLREETHLAAREDAERLRAGVRVERLLG